MADIETLTQVEKWTDGDIELEVEVKLTVNFQEIRDNLYYQVFLKGDEKGEYDIREFLTEKDREWIEKNIIDKMGEE